MDSPQPTREQFEELKARVAELEKRLAVNEARTEAIDAACRAFAVVFAIPRLPDKPGDEM